MVDEYIKQCGLRTIEQAKRIPGGKVQWLLSKNHQSHDICDEYAHGGKNHDGIYEPDECPPYPAHDGCKCCLSPAVDSPEDFARKLRELL